MSIGRDVSIEISTNSLLALNEIKKEPTDVIVLDNESDGLNPFVLTKLVKRDRFLQNIKIFFVTDEDDFTDDAHYQEILSYNGDEDMLFGEIAVKLGYLDETEVMQGLSEQQMVPYVDLNKFNVDHNAVQFLDKETARKLMAIPLFEVDDILAVGLSNASDIATLDELELKTGKTIQAVLCSKEALKNIIQSSYSIDLMDSQDLEDKDDSVIIELVQKIIEEAVESNASDIHIQPSEFELDIRYRIDGVLQSIMVMPNYRVKAINSRLKVMSNLDIAESRKPQDGRFKHQMPSGKVFDFRISTYPTEYGEKTVMRILDPSKGQISLDKLGFSAVTLKKWQKAISNSTGIILVTGPTGSGKSTTLYATLGILNSPDVNIITALPLRGIWF